MWDEFVECEDLCRNAAHAVATVTISRSLVGEPSKCSDPFMDITCEFHDEGGVWLLATAMDEDDNDVRLTDTELLLAESLVNAGVDETGR